MTGATHRHALSVDVEDWYHDAGEPVQSPRRGRVEANVDRLLELFARHDARATFFFLGEVAEQHPSLARRVAAAGHEIASHGHRHRRVTSLLREEFRADVTRSLRVLENITGRRIAGYRAPYFSIKSGVRWPVETLAELGLDYDSSILPIDRPPGLALVCPRVPYRLESGIVEIPIAILRMLHFWHLPLASGAGLRMVPRGLLYRCLRRFERDVGSGVFYLHPWELDVDSPTRPAAGRWMLRVGRARLAMRLEELLTSHRFGPIEEVFRAHLEPGAEAAA
ncbi:MAG: DUF3473 domain-containing protein [Myxococcales bacterium]|nr:MAG: DUF3473 domain-containing protein [Myxococcales bacterium]